MMKYRYTYYVLLCLTLVGLASCEMKDELLGKGEQGGSGEVGVLDLKLKVVPPSYGNGGRIFQVIKYGTDCSESGRYDRESV